MTPSVTIDGRSVEGRVQFDVVDPASRHVLAAGRPGRAEAGGALVPGAGVPV